MKNIFRIVILVIFAFSQLLIVFSANAQNAPGKVLPRVDDEAAYTERNTEETAETAAKTMRDEADAYPQKLWIFLFGVYLFLLVFNLYFGLESGRKQWFWEAAYTFLAVFAWDNLDIGRNNAWFPGVVMEAGIIIYASYLYLLGKKSKSEISGA